MLLVEWMNVRVRGLESTREQRSSEGAKGKRFWTDRVVPRCWVGGASASWSLHPIEVLLSPLQNGDLTLEQKKAIVESEAEAVPSWESQDAKGSRL